MFAGVKRKLCLFLGVVFCLTCVEARKGYVFTFPQELQVGAKETFCLSLFNVTTDVTIQLNISCYGKTVQHQPDVFRKGQHGCFSMELPEEFTAGTCKLELAGEDDTKDYTFQDDQELEVVDNNQITFVQTDRPIYRPGHTVQFRILTVTQNLLPVLENIESVTIQDPNDFFMEKWTNLPVKSGLASLDYKLYEEPVLGDWKIVTVVNGRKTEKQFTVKEYVLPKFEVTTTLPKTLTVATKSLEFEVCAVYTFGKPVMGKLNASVCLIDQETPWFCEKNIRPCVVVQSKIDGCHTFTVNTSQLNVTDRRFSLLCKPRLVLKASVTEQNAGELVEAEESGTGVWEQRVKLRFQANKYFKPFFPYTGKLHASFPDGSPVSKEKIVLSIGKLGIKQTLTTDTAGYVNFTIQNLTHNMDFFVLHAKTLDEETIDTKLYTISPATAKKHVKQWYSPTSSYIHLATIKQGPYSCGNKVDVDVIYSLKPEIFIESFMSQAISRGMIVYDKDILDEMGHSIPHNHKYSGLVFTPKLVKPEPDSEEKPFEINGPQGPPRQIPDGPPGPPGSQGGSVAAPPGSRPGGSKAPVSQLIDVNLSHSPDPETDEDSQTNSTDSPPPEIWKLTLKVNVTEQMSPKVRLLVYFITNEGEIVADTIDFRVHNCHKNKVTMSFSEPSKHPGDRVTMSISAEPHSLCSASLVDRGVYLLGGNNLLLQSQIDKRLEEFDLTSDFINDWKYCSDLSDMPFVLSAAGPVKDIGMPGTYEDVDFHHSPFRKKRDIMQFYSNMYDSLLAFKVAGVRTLSDLDLQTRPCLHDGSYLGPPLIPGEPRGPIPGPYGMDDLDTPPEPVDIQLPSSKFRRHFPDTWLWDLYEIPSNGTVKVTPTLPGSITQWVGNSFCTNSHSGLGVSDVATVTGFQPFFMSVKLPYSVIRGELVHIHVEVYNYLKHCIAVQLSLAKNGKFLLEGDKKKEPQMCICEGQSKSHTFKIKTQILGKISLIFSTFLKEHRVKCNSARAPRGYTNNQVNDVVVKELLVEAEGLEEERTSSFYICPQDSVAGVFEKQIQPNIPGSLLVKDSLRSWISVIGDIMGPVLSGLENLVLLPTGCGEQNMVRLAPNIAILEYLTVTMQLTIDIEAKTLDHLHKGYQQQLKFMHSSGAFSAFGKADDHGSTWLSAFVFKTLRKASKFIYIDRKQIQTKTWEFLITQQGEDGCFEENGNVLSKYMTGGVVGNKEHKPRALTAYVLVAMLESFKMMRERTPPFVALAVKCIELDSLNDTYTLALTTYAMTLYKPNSHFTDILLARLKEKAIVEDDVMYWKRDVQPRILAGQGRAASAEVEITAYALLAMLTKDKNIPVREVIPIIRWLTNQRNAYGGFASTQDTVVALQALSLFAQRIYGKGLNVSVSIDNGISTSIDFHVNQSNSIILQQQNLPEPDAELNITAKGEGCVLLQATSHYNVMNTVNPGSKTFTLSVTTPVTMEIINNNCRTRQVRVCTSYIGPDGVSDMVIVEVKLTSGWIPNVNTLDKLLNSVELGLKKYEMDYSHPDVVNFYFDSLEAKEICFEFSIVLEVEIKNKQLAVAKVFDYYDTDQQATVFYELSLCDEGNIEEVDINLNNSDLYIEENNVVVQDSNLITSGDDSDSDTETENNVPSPIVELVCPQCIITGTVNILQDICQKQVWVLELSGHNMSIQIVTADRISPPLLISMPPELMGCDICLNKLLHHGQVSLAVLQPDDWQNLGLNLAKSNTVIIPWSDIVQTAIQKQLDTCTTK